MHPTALEQSIALCLNSAAVLDSCRKPYQASVGWKSRSFDSPKERADYEVAFVGYPCPPLVHCEAAQLGYHDAAKTAGWRAEHGTVAPFEPMSMEEWIARGWTTD